jgi:hypothetical protein
MALCRALSSLVLVTALGGLTACSGGSDSSAPTTTLPPTTTTTVAPTTTTTTIPAPVDEVSVRDPFAPTS